MTEKPLSVFLNRVSSISKGIWALTDRDFSDKEMKWIMAALVLVLSCFIFVRDIERPSQAFWDESYYVTAAERYVRDQAQYASHPPLAFMIMDIGITITGANKALDTKALADSKKLDADTKLTKGYDFTGIRIMAALFSVVSALLFYLIVLKLVNEPFEAFVFSLLFLFENAFIVHFRAAHLDPYQMTFTLGAVLVWLTIFGHNPKRPLFTYIGFGVLCGLSFMVKVNSLVMLALGAISLGRTLYENRNIETLKICVARGLSVLTAFASVVILIFSLHVVLNPQSPDPKSAAGASYRTYMDQSYRDYLDKKRPLSVGVIWDATKGYYGYMKNDFTGIIKTEENGSRAVEWPFMHRIINYRWDFDGTKTGYIQMIGNPINWGLALVGTLAAMGLSVRRRLFRDTKLEGTDIARLEGLLCMYLLYWGFHIWLGTQRVMYIYHYFIALCLAYFMTALAFKVIMTRYAHLFKWRLYAQLTIAVSIAIGFIFYAPLTYHQKLSRQECELRNIPFKAVVCQPKLKKPL